jgi:hypothetical protein
MTIKESFGKFKEKIKFSLQKAVIFIKNTDIPPYNFPTEGKKIIEGEGFYASIPYNSDSPDKSKAKSIRLMREELQKRGAEYSGVKTVQGYEQHLLNACEELGISETKYYNSLKARRAVLKHSEPLKELHRKQMGTAVKKVFSK